MTAQEADAALMKVIHEAVKAARAIADESLRANMLAKLVEIDRLHSVSLAARHAETLHNRTY